MAGEERAHVTIGTDAKQDDIEAWRRAENFDELGFVGERPGVELCRIARHAVHTR